MEIRKASHLDVSPHIDSNSHTLILGSMLSPKSAQEKFYYAHPQNRFWKILSTVFNNDRQPKTIEERKQLALSNGLALWDVVKTCDIIGASDSTIKNVIFNDINELLKKYPKINRVFTTGKKAHELLHKYNLNINNPLISKAICLPSTSPQNFKIGISEIVNAYAILTRI